MALPVTRPKEPGETRYIDYLEEYLCFKVSHTYNESLITAFKARFPPDDIKCMQPIEDRTGAIGRRWWRVKSSAGNCLALLKWGIQNDYRFTTRALLRLDAVAKKLHEKKTAKVG